MITRQNFETKCADGVILRGFLLIPAKPKAVVQFNGGTAAKKEFYLPFLTYLAEHDYLCCLWDYRGSGDSAPANLKECSYTFRDYGMKDMPTIKKFLSERYPDLLLLIFSHSAGGQQVGFAEDLSGYAGMVSFAVSTGYLPNMPLFYRLKSYYFFYLFTPLSHFLFGYLRAKELGYMEDLPRNVVLEWRDWCRNKNYFFAEKFADKSVPVKRYSALPFPIHIFWSPDDPISNRHNVADFWGNVQSTAGISFTELIPAEYGEKKIEHFGFFKKRMKDKFWHSALAKLEEFLTRSNQANADSIKANLEETSDTRA